jgi:hypothetical protein
MSGVSYIANLLEAGTKSAQPTWECAFYLRLTRSCYILYFKQYNTDFNK